MIRFCLLDDDVLFDVICLLYRTIGVGFSSLCARIGGMAAPYIVVRKKYCISYRIEQST